jgi:hypothetical protein
LTAAYVPADEWTDRWHADLDVARGAWLARDRSYSPAARAAAEQRLADLQRRVDALRDEEIVAELARIAALSGNAHTRAYILRNRGYWRRYPVRIWKFEDGWRVVAAQGEGLRLVGRRIVAIDGVPIADAQAAVRPLFAGNARWADYMATYSLTSPEALRTSGIIATDTATFTVRDEQGKLTLPLRPLPHAPRDRPEESWWFLSPAHPATAGWQHALAGSALPVALQRVASNYWTARCAGDLVYFQFNRAQEGAGEALIPFGQHLVDEIGDRPPRILVIDVRFNTGGDASKAHQFLKRLTTLPWVREPGRVVMLVGPNTFSAGITHAVWLRKESAARFVGTEPGDELDSWSEGGNVDLPHSRLRLHFADMAHLYSNRAHDIPRSQVLVDWDIESLAPDRRAEWSWDDYRAARDPFAEAALGTALDCPR